MRKRQEKKRKKGQIPITDLPVIREKVAGIDIATKEHWVCGPQRADNEPNVKIFGTTTTQLIQLADWLIEQEVVSVAVESTSVYWIPLYEILDSRGIEVNVVNARQLKNVPGRKSDMHECQWLQILHSHGLLRGSFRPPEEICVLRALRRQRDNLIEERSKSVQWMQKALDQMNVQVHHAVSDITGITGMKIVRDIVAGKRNPMKLAKHRDHRCQKSVEEIAEYLTGNFRTEHLFNLKSALQLYDHLQQQIASYEKQIEDHIRKLQPPKRKDEEVPPHPNKRKEGAMQRKGEQPLRQELYRLAGVDLCRIDGINIGATQVVLSEIGLDLSVFPTEHHFVSWIQLAPYNPSSGGKRLKKKRKSMGATRVGGVLRQGALSLKNSTSALGATYRRIARRKDSGVAVFAVARRLAILIYRMLRYGQDYVDEGEKAYNARFQQRRLLSLNHTASTLGYRLVPVAATASATN